MATVREIIAVIQGHALTAGAKQAPVDPPEGNAGFPFSVCYIGSSTILVEAQSQRRDIVVLNLDFHIARAHLPMDVQAALSFYESFPDLLVNDPLLAGTSSGITFGREAGIGVAFGGMEYAGIETIGFRFTIPVKIRSATA